MQPKPDRPHWFLRPCISIDHRFLTSNCLLRSTIRHEGYCMPSAETFIVSDRGLQQSTKMDKEGKLIYWVYINVFKPGHASE